MIVMFHGNKTRKPRKSKHEQKHLGTIFIIAPVTKGGFFQKNFPKNIISKNYP